MERSMEIKLVSARDLNNVNLLMKMDAYVVVKLVDDGAGNAKAKTKQKFQSPVDKEGGSNPIWNFAMKFAVDEAAARANRLSLVFKLRCQRNLGDKDIGVVYVPVKELLDWADGGGGGNSMQHLSYQVRKPSGNPQGVLNFAYKFGDNSAAGPVKPAAVDVFKPAAAEVHNSGSAYPVVSSGPVSVGYGGVYPPPPPQPEAYPPSSNFYSVPPPKAAEAEAYPPSSSNFYPVPPPKAAEAEAYPPSSSNFYPVPPPKVAAPPLPDSGYSVYPQLEPSYSAYSAAPSYSAFSPAPPQPGYGYQHQPPPMAASYGYPPPPFYGYRPQPAYYPPPAPHKKNNMGLGLGLGAGLVGGMVGGLLIGDLVSDAAGYDAGFSDSGGFGF